jgi:enediyne biosynthesis protein E4
MDNIELTEPTLRHLEPPLLLKNEQGRFSNISHGSGSVFTTPSAARGAAFGDLDNDGFVDIAINCNDGHAIILRNQADNGNHWIALNLIGTSSNRDAIGAKIRLLTDAGQQTRFVSTAGSYISASDKRAHFGLGSSKKIHLVEITWPSGIVQHLESVNVDQILTVKEPSR